MAQKIASRGRHVGSYSRQLNALSKISLLWTCFEPDAAHRSDGFVEGRENPCLADRSGDAVPVHVGPQVGRDEFCAVNTAR
jgi:hypothetical protein